MWTIVYQISNTEVPADLCKILPMKVVMIALVDALPLTAMNMKDVE